MNRRRASIIRGSAWVVLLLAAPAAARSRTLVLSVSAPPECHSAERIESDVDELVRQSQGEPLRSSLTIHRTAQGFSAALSIRGAPARSLAAPSCEAVVEAATVILALAIDPQASTRARRASSPSRQRAVSEGGADSLRVQVGAAPAFDSSTLPHVAIGTSLRAGVASTRWSLDGVGTYWLPASRSLPSEPSVGGRFTWWTVAVSGCLGGLATKPRLFLCLEPELGRLEGTGTGTPNDRSVGATWVALSLLPNLVLDLSPRVKFRAALGAAVTLQGRHAFLLERSGESLEVHRPERLSLRGRFGLDVLF